MKYSNCLLHQQPKCKMISIEAPSPYILIPMVQRFMVHRRDPRTFHLPPLAVQLFLLIWWNLSTSTWLSSEFCVAPNDESYWLWSFPEFSSCFPLDELFSFWWFFKFSSRTTIRLKPKGTLSWWTWLLKRLLALSHSECVSMLRNLALSTTLSYYILTELLAWLWTLVNYLVTWKMTEINVADLSSVDWFVN